MAPKFTTERPVVDGRVECPFHRIASVQECARCTWLRTLRRTNAEAVAVVCRPPTSPLADLPPV
jgi:hypothetical protein